MVANIFPQDAQGGRITNQHKRALVESMGERILLKRSDLMQLLDSGWGFTMSYQLEHWEGMAEMFRKAITASYEPYPAKTISRLAYRRDGLSNYGIYGVLGGNHDDYLSRIDTAIRQLNKARGLFLAAEEARKKIADKL